MARVYQDETETLKLSLRNVGVAPTAETGPKVSPLSRSKPVRAHTAHHFTPNQLRIGAEWAAKQEKAS